jgi:ribose transport system permease protein
MTDATNLPQVALGTPMGERIRLQLRRNAWTIGLFVLLGLMLALTRVIQPDYGTSGVDSLARAALPVAFAAVAQAVVVISGGIDLSVGSMMALTNVVAATLMAGQSEEFAIVAVAATLLLGAVLGFVNGILVVVTRVPDIVVTLAMSFVWAGAALLVMNTPGGGAASWLKGLPNGGLFTDWLPRGLVVLLVSVGVVWIPLRRSRAGLAIYAVGSDRLAAFRSGVGIARTKVLAYAITGLFCAMGGLALSMSTGIGTPTAGPYTLLSVAAIVLGGVSLAGGRGGLLGCIVAVYVLRLVRTDLTFLGVDPNYTTVVEGLIMVVVVMVGAVVALRRRQT